MTSLGDRLCLYRTAANPSSTSTIIATPRANHVALNEMANHAQPDPMEQVSSNAAPAALPNGTQPAGEEADPAAAEPTQPVADPKLPTRKDASLKDFLNKMDDYAPIVRPPPPPPYFPFPR